MQVLKGHYSPETAYVVDDYPYGFKLRCKIRYWLEVNGKKGTRFWSQTTNPKKGDMWNTPKASTYAMFGAMYLNEEGHCQWASLSMWNGDKVQAYLDTYGEGLTEEQKVRCKNLADLYAGKKPIESHTQGV